MVKFYAIRKGKKEGIFNSWKECEALVKGFSGAEYKSFPDLESAKIYLKGHDKDTNKNDEVSELIVYVDGSFSKSRNIAGYGCAFIKNEKLIHTISKIIELKDENLWNVSAEISGALAAVEWAMENGYKSLNIYYDYEGIQKWVDGSWEAKKDSTKMYQKKMKEYAGTIDLYFTKVKAHSGDFYNDLVDKLAKDALIQTEFQKVEISKEKDIEHKIDLTLYREIVGATNQQAIKLEASGYVFNDSILNKIAKHFWKREGKKIKDLDGMEINFNLKTLICGITYIMKEKNKIQINVRFMEEDDE